MTKHWIAQALNWLTQSLEPIPHELNELDWKAGLTGNKERLKIAEKQRAQVSRLIRDALDSGRIKLKDPHSKSSKFTEHLPYWS